MSLQRQTKLKTHVSHVITFDIWESLNYEIMTYLLQVILLQPSDFWMGAEQFGQGFVFSSLYFSDINSSLMDNNWRFPYRFSIRVFSTVLADKYLLTSNLCSFDFTLIKITGVINDPLGQALSPVANIVFAWIRFVLKSGDGRTTCAKTMITTGCDCGSALWIKTRDNSSWGLVDH